MDKEYVGDLLEVIKVFYVGEILVLKGSLK